jgi:hypothetical protein
MRAFIVLLKAGPASLSAGIHTRRLLWHVIERRILPQFFAIFSSIHP